VFPPKSFLVRPRQQKKRRVNLKNSFHNYNEVISERKITKSAGRRRQLCVVLATCLFSAATFNKENSADNLNKLDQFKPTIEINYSSFNRMKLGIKIPCPACKSANVTFES